MASRQAIRIIAAAATAGAGIALAAWAGASPFAALLAALGGVAAYALAVQVERPAPAPPEPEDEEDEPAPLPGIAELLRAVDEPLLVVRDRRVLAANAAARQLLGAHIEGVDVRLAIRHPAAAERLAGPAGADDQNRRTELVGIGDPGRHWAMAVTVLPDQSRLVRLSDLSAARAAEQMRVDFVANASHELRTPLATVLGFIETLQDEDAGGDRKTRERFLRIMFDEGTRMRNLVDDLMSLSRIEAERFTVPREPVDLMPVIGEVKAALGQLIEAKQASVVVEKETPDTVVQGDRPQLAQLLNNLIANALKYGRAGAPVRVRLEGAGGEMIRLSVIDEGEGIPAEHLPRLTERFYRVDTGRSRAAGGTGLGLAIVKHIVLRHRGRLDIDSVLGQGTTIRVYLPRALAGHGVQQ
ncbi:ATP-binding protein [Sphingosinicella sp. LHD-64]|uniref:ATP-binding protein n=1 Tax=Sphingosinicella sp. LHD-64 TaxID=3072139 RepID=UPI00280CD018|nr:ATP-binding protein [Sphingosinicella sp. LHD-64]MDQ8757778.1 ATP-binding protein [Sphingosinicella sp. LHD-64]